MFKYRNGLFSEINEIIWNIMDEYVTRVQPNYKYIDPTLKNYILTLIMEKYENEINELEEKLAFIEMRVDCFNQKTSFYIQSEVTRNYEQFYYSPASENDKYIEDYSIIWCLKHAR